MSDSRVGLGVLAACACGGLALGFWWAHSCSGSRAAAASSGAEALVADGFVGLVGNTPLMELAPLFGPSGMKKRCTSHIMQAELLHWAGASHHNELRVFLRDRARCDDFIVMIILIFYLILNLSRANQCSAWPYY